jgi:hypothetical protein
MRDVVIYSSHIQWGRTPAVIVLWGRLCVKDMDAMGRVVGGAVLSAMGQKLVEIGWGATEGIKDNGLAVVVILWAENLS